MSEDFGARSALDSFEILTTSGILLWSKKYSPVNASVVNSFISDVLIEERVQPGSDGKWYKKDSYTLKWTTANDLGLIFIAVYQSLLQLTWIDELLDTVKKLFTSLYGDQLKKPYTSAIECHFDDYFTSRVQELEKKYGTVARATINVPSTDVSRAATPQNDKWDAPPPLIPGLLKAPVRPGSPAVNGLVVPATPDNPRPISPGPLGSSGVITAKRARGGRGRRNKGSTHASSGDEVSPAPSSKKGGKKLRKWDDEGNADEDDGKVLDYSAQQDGSREESGRKLDYIEQTEWGKKTSKGEFVLKELGEEVDAILKQADAKQSVSGSAFGFFRNFVGGKVLTKEDMDKALAGMKDHLLKKNVAQEAANDIVKNVENSLVGQKTGSFQSIEAIVRSAVEAAIKRILTPTNSLDLLREIQQKRSRGSRPYVISIVGVNGVGKSTNLSKICFFLLQNKYKVLIAACDTFRSGAVEQLRVHARNLKELSDREGGVVELYEKGYGKDAASIAKDAVEYAEKESFDVVLIDTAGRRHNDVRLMSSLEKFAKFAVPDKILMVGEALVGTDSVMQARNFNAAFGSQRTLDGFIISKCDTVGDMIGTLISMVFATGIPVVFLGVGQNYQDLRTLNIGWAVGLLMS
ncbi:signal recognition particle, alpha subunit, N-terminal-domain-containing protein [Trichophaea hybrida]|nr:signal recognition particle, alpha subunit, N-terminal-domain-containing protein [Trichophaea hybrida]